MEKRKNEEPEHTSPIKRVKKQPKPLPPGMEPLSFPEGCSEERKRQLQSEFDRKVAKIRQQQHREAHFSNSRPRINPMEERKSFRRDQVCKYFQRGNCMRGEGCEFKHDVSQMSCKYHHWFQSCKLGETCPYSHDEPTPEQMEAMLKEMEGTLSKNPCKFLHIQGRCRKNEQGTCPFSHNPLEEGSMEWRIIQEQKKTFVVRSDPRYLPEPGQGDKQSKSESIEKVVDVHR
jgi:hypothetical protein